jgi:hypothetical protein
MGRPRKPTASPPPRDPFEAWGDVPSDKRSERKRLARIVARNGRRIDNYRAFCRELGGACHDANSDLYERLRYEQTAVAAVLDDLRQKMADARKALRELGADAAEALNEAIVGERRDRQDDCLWYHLESPDLTWFEPSWAERGEWVGRALADCEGWADKACEAVGKRPPGRPQDQVTRDLVQKLGELWRKQTGRPPTVATDWESYKKSGDFLEFCEEVIMPIWENRGVNLPAVEAFVKNYLYPPKK